MPSLYIIALMATIWCSVFMLPWHWLTRQLLRWMSSLGRWCYARAPQSWQRAWKGLPHIEYRLAGILQLVVVAILLWRGFLAQQYAVLALAALVCAMILALPLFRACRQQHSRKTKLIAALPAQLDLLAMLLVAGQPLLSSLHQSSASGIDNPLREELRALVSQVRAGVAVDVAFERLAERYPCRELRLFCSALRHARESGAGLAGILYEQAEQRRQELFLQAEKKAMEAPVKLMFPLLMFIFPGTVLVLVVTLAAKMMWKL